MSNYTTKADLKHATGIHTSKLAAKCDLASLKAEVDKIDIEKLKTLLIDLRNLSSVVKNEVVRKTVYDKLVSEVNNIDTSGFVLKTKYDTDKSDLEKKNSDSDRKIPDTSGLVRKTDYNAKITEIGGKISSISGLATNSALTAIENEIPNFSNLVKKINEIEKKITGHSLDKHITTPGFNKLTAKKFASRLAQANLVAKTVFDDKLKNFNKEINSNKTKHVLVENIFSWQK